jgi:penicillin-binding protein 1A
MLDRLREERRVRRDFEKLIQSEGFRQINSSWVGDREQRPSIWSHGRKWWIKRVALVTVLVLITSAMAFLYAPLPFDPPAPLQTVFVYDRDGNLIARIRPDEDRVVLPLEKIPPRVRQAVIASEDERFYNHGGVDFKAILRAAWNDVRGRPIQGGSTLTQQLVKEYYVGGGRSIWRKIREAALALRLERKYTKDEILEQYLNVIYLGDQAYGVEAAARRYFGKSIADVTLAEAALLASIAPAPARYNPRLDLEAARIRRDRVLERMVVNDFITRGEATEARKEEIRLVRPKPPPSKAPIFVQYVRESFVKEHGQDALDKSGLRLTTTLDLDLQQAAQEAIDQTLTEPDDPAAALISIDVRTGGILAMAQRGRGFYNLAVQGHRQAGSAFKPFVLAAALDEGIDEYDYYYAPSTVTIGDWSPTNYDGSSWGTVSVRTATIYSINTAYAQIIEDVGATDVADMAHAMGIVSPLDEDLTLTLGTSSVSPLEMTSAYATLAAQGIRRTPSGILEAVDGDGEEIQRITTNGNRVMGENLAARVTDILKDVVQYGTGTRARLDEYEAAGKTGTTNSNRDAWFCGYTSEVATCVWMGYTPVAEPMDSVHGISVSGGSFPAEIWNRFMAKVPVPETDLEGAVVDPQPGPATTPTPTPTAGGGPGPSTPPTTDPTVDPTPSQDCGILPIC